MKKIIKIIFISLSLMLILCACSSKTEIYSAALYINCFSEDNGNIVYQHSNNSLFLENSNGITDLYEYSYLDDYYSMKNPFLYNEKLYYITSSRNDTLCIAMLNINDLKKAEILTPEKENIHSFTVIGHKIYYYVYDSGKSAIYSFDTLKGKETEILSTDYYIYNFFVSDDNIIFANKKYDLNKNVTTDLTKELRGKDVEGLGIIGNTYYCNYSNMDTSENEIYAIDLNNHKISLVCKLPQGINKPRLYYGKILYENFNENDPQYLSLSYYDLKIGEVKVAFNKTSDCYKYDKLLDNIDNYDSFYYEGNFYMWYPDAVVKINNTNDDTMIGFREYKTEEGNSRLDYDWITYNEYLDHINY